MGVFFLVETFRGMELRRRLLASIAAVGILIPGVYLLINRIYGIRYDFGIPALSMIAMIWVLAKIDFSFVGLMKKGLMVAFFITALQFLDMMPLLWNFPFGRGESSYDIKLVSKFLQADSFLQAMATIFLLCSSSCPCCSCCWWWMKTTSAASASRRSSTSTC